MFAEGMRKIGEEINLFLKPLWNMLNREENLAAILKVTEKKIIFCTNVTIIP